MTFDLTIAGRHVTFTRDWLTGLARLELDDSTRVTLQSPWDPGTHFSILLKRRWECEIGSHELVIEKIRPLLLPALLPHDYRFFVDGTLVAEVSGY